MNTTSTFLNEKKLFSNLEISSVKNRPENNKILIALNLTPQNQYELKDF
jgi:hypothetical protein